MAETKIEIAVSSKDLLKAAEKLPTKDLDRFVTAIVALRDRRNGHHSSPKESRLLRIIHGGFSAAEQTRWDKLVDKLEAETLTPAERKELLRMSAESEHFAAKRLRALIQLAKLRKTTVDNLMDEMRLRPRDR